MPATIREIISKFGNELTKGISALAGAAENTIDGITGAIEQPSSDLINGYSDYFQAAVEKAGATGPVSVMSYDDWTAKTPEGRGLSEKAIGPHQKENAKHFVANSKAFRELKEDLIQDGRKIIEVASDTADQAKDGAGGMMESIGKFFEDNKMGAIGTIVGGVILSALGAGPVMLLLGALLIGGMMGMGDGKKGLLSSFMGGNQEPAVPAPNALGQKIAQAAPVPENGLVQVVKDEKPVVAVQNKKPVFPDEKATDVKPREVTFEIADPDKKTGNKIRVTGQVSADLKKFTVSKISTLLPDSLGGFEVKNTLAEQPVALTLNGKGEVDFTSPELRDSAMWKHAAKQAADYAKIDVIKLKAVTAGEKLEAGTDVKAELGKVTANGKNYTVVTEGRLTKSDKGDKLKIPFAKIYLEDDKGNKLADSKGNPVSIKYGDGEWVPEMQKDGGIAVVSGSTREQAVNFANEILAKSAAGTSTAVAAASAAKPVAPAPAVEVIPAKVADLNAARAMAKAMTYINQDEQKLKAGAPLGYSVELVSAPLPTPKGNLIKPDAALGMSQATS